MAGGDREQRFSGIVRFLNGIRIFQNNHCNIVKPPMCCTCICQTKADWHN